MFTSNNISMEKDEKIPEKVKIDTYISQQDSCAPQPTPEPNGLNQPQQIQNTQIYQPQPQVLYQQTPQVVYPQSMYSQPLPMLQDNINYNNPMMVQQPVPMQVPVVPIIRFVPDPMALLANAKKARIKQKFEYLEVLSGCEMQNEYYVSYEDAEGNRQYLFKAKEISTWACRTFCVGAIREFKLDLKKIEYTSQDKRKK